MSLRFSFAMAVHSYTVHVYLYHSPIHAFIFLPSAYESLSDLSLPNIAAWSDPNSIYHDGPGIHLLNGEFSKYQNKPGGYVLQGAYPATTSLHAIKQLLHEQCNIPIAIQFHFTDVASTVNNRWSVGRVFEDETTLKEVWEDEHEEDREDGIVQVTLVTTAGRLKEMDVYDTKQGRLIDRIKALRHLRAVLKYLRSKTGGSLSSEQRDLLEENIKQEKNMRGNISKLLSDWDRLVYGTAEETGQNAMEIPEAIESDIEARFEHWDEKKKEILHRSTGNTEVQKEKSQEQGGTSTQIEDPVNFDIPAIADSPKNIVSKPLRDQAGKLIPESDGFTIHSGTLLWGHLHTVFAGSIDQEFQGNAETIPAMLPGGTIMQYPLKYRSAARNGKWKVRKTFSNLHSPDGVGEPRNHFGWVVYHEDVDALEVVERCSRITPASGISLGNRHIDKVSTSRCHTLTPDITFGIVICQFFSFQQ